MSAEEWTLSRLKDNPVDALERIHALEAEVRDAKIDAAKERGLSEQHVRKVRALETEVAELIEQLTKLGAVRCFGCGAKYGEACRGSHE